MILDHCPHGWRASCPEFGRAPYYALAVRRTSQTARGRSIAAVGPRHDHGRPRHVPAGPKSPCPLPAHFPQVRKTQRSGPCRERLGATQTDGDLSGPICRKAGRS